MWKRQKPGEGDAASRDPFLAFVLEVARRRRIELPLVRAEHVVDAALRMSRSVSASELRVGIVLLK